MLLKTQTLDKSKKNSAAATQVTASTGERGKIIRNGEQHFIHVLIQ